MELSPQQWEMVRQVAQRVARPIVRDEETAADVAAETVARLLDSSVDLADDGALRAFTIVAARNAATDVVRQQERAREGRALEDLRDDELQSVRTLLGLAALSTSPSSAFARNERAQRQIAVAGQILATLTPQQVRLLQLAADEVPAEQIAEQLGYASAGVVRVTLHRLKARLRADFADLVTSSLFRSSDVGRDARR